MLLQADSQESLDSLTKGFGILGFTGLFERETVVGVNCSPIGAAGFTCDNTPMCCEDNSFNVGAVFAFFFLLADIHYQGAIALGCTNLLAVL